MFNKIACCQNEVLPFYPNLMIHHELYIDRQYLFMHGLNLVIFAERVLRNTADNPNLNKPASVWESLKTHASALRMVLTNQELKRKLRTEAMREQEHLLLIDLKQMAEYVESTIAFKSDIYTTGFRPQTEQRRPGGTLRGKRILAKLEALEEG
jgi:hypothetical protein